MSKQKAVGYVRDSRGKAGSAEEQRNQITEYCKKQGYELVDCFETNRTFDGNQLDRLEEFIREHLGIIDETVRLIPTTLSRMGRSLDVARSMMIALQTKDIEIEPVDVGSQNRVEVWRRMQDPFPELTRSIKESEGAEGPIKRISCSFCGGTGNNLQGCSCNRVELDGNIFKRIPFGSETNVLDAPFCPDCGALPGRYHHSHCDIDQCPACGKRIYDCACQMSFILEEDLDISEEEFDVLKVAKAVQTACEADQSKSKLVEIRKYVVENYDPDLSSEENAALIAVMYLSEAKRTRTNAGRAHRNTSKH